MRIKRYLHLCESRWNVSITCQFSVIKRYNIIYFYWTEIWRIAGISYDSINCRLIINIQYRPFDTQTFRAVVRTISLLCWISEGESARSSKNFLNNLRHSNIPQKRIRSWRTKGKEPASTLNSDYPCTCTRLEVCQRTDSVGAIPSKTQGLACTRVYRNNL